MPIGNLTSQLWANVYLDDFDHWVKEHLGVKEYLRFVDDFIMLSDSKEQLKEWRRRVEGKLAEIRLLPHQRKTVVRRTSEGMPFLGYLIWPTRVRVLGETVRRFRRRLRQADGDSAEAQEKRQRSLAAWSGHVGIAGSWRKLGGLK